MKGAGFKTKVRETVERQTIDRFINTEHQTEDDFISNLLNVGETDEFTNALKEKAEKEQALYEESQAKIQAQAEKVAEVEDEVGENEDVKSDYESSDSEETTEIEKVVAKPIVSADEIKPELVEYIKAELVEKMQNERSSVITEFINGRAVSQEEFFKLQLLSCFPVLGIPMYFFSLVTLSANINNKYAVSIQNYAKSQLKTFWIYLIGHCSTVFLGGASLVSLIGVMRRGFMFLLG